MEDIMLCDYADDDEVQCVKIVKKPNITNLNDYADVDDDEIQCTKTILWIKENDPERIKPNAVRKRARTSTKPKHIIDLNEDFLKGMETCRVLDLRGLTYKILNENDILQFVSKANKLKDLIQEGFYFSEEIMKQCPDLLEYVRLCKLKQLKIHGYRLDDLIRNNRYLYKLKRLNISGRSVGMYNEPILMKLKILKMSLRVCAYLLIKSNKHIVSGSTVNYNMRDLVLIYCRQMDLNVNKNGAH
uniref:Uncharacterized protein n=1 Tax=Tetranychus urticae TaxID=32264 RepID=T1KGS7_TETUR